MLQCQKSSLQSSEQDLGFLLATNTANSLFGIRSLGLFNHMNNDTGFSPFLLLVFQHVNL